MSNGDPIKAGDKTTATETTCLFAAADNFQFGSGGPICFVGAPIDAGNITTTDLDCLIGKGNHSGTGVVGWGGIDQGTGVVGWGGVNFEGHGGKWTIFQSGGTGAVGAGGPGTHGYTLGGSALAGGEIYLPTPAGWGVLGFGGAGEGAANIPNNASDGVAATPGVGVYGGGGEANGAPLPGSGVVGVTPDPNIGFPPYSVYTGNGVAGTGPTGVYGFSVQGVAIHGAVSPPPKKGAQGRYAGWFDGPVQVTENLVVVGDFTVMGAKNVAVPFADGSHRRLYCMESPECWFEDFGEAKLVRGKAQIKLPSDFAAVIDVDSYHVFLAPYGRSNGLYVSKRTRQGFAVEEQGDGKSSLSFSFRIVGKRKGFKAERFARVKVSKELPTLPKLDPKLKETPPRKPSIQTARLNALSAAPSVARGPRKR
jgi:hypothetical protein